MPKVAAPTSIVLTARTKRKTTGANATRQDGLVPGVVYGHGAAPLAIGVTAKTLEDIVITKSQAHIFDATIDGVADSVMIRSIERHPISRRALSVDFQRVGKHESIHRSVTVHTVGISSGEKKQGGVKDIVSHEVTLTGPADVLPDTLEVDITALNVGDHITAAQIKLPDGVHMDTDGATIIVAIEASKTADLVAGDEAAAAAAAPEAAPAADAAPTEG